MRGGRCFPAIRSIRARSSSLEDRSGYGQCRRGFAWPCSSRSHDGLLRQRLRAPKQRRATAPLGRVWGLPGNWLTGWRLKSWRTAVSKLQCHLSSWRAAAGRPLFWSSIKLSPASWLCRPALLHSLASAGCARPARRPGFGGPTIPSGFPVRTADRLLEPWARVLASQFQPRLERGTPLPCPRSHAARTRGSTHVSRAPVASAPRRSRDPSGIADGSGWRALLELHDHGLPFPTTGPPTCPTHPANWEAGAPCWPFMVRRASGAQPRSRKRVLEHAGATP